MLLPHRELAVAMVLRSTGDPAEAEDCVHDAMLRLVRREDLDPARVRSLLVRAALHIAIDHRRSAGRRQSAVLRLGGGAAAEVTSPEQVLAERTEAERLLAAVDRLPRRERQVMLLRLAGLSVAETARRLGISVKSVEGAYTRARARVRLLLGGILAWLLDRIRRTASRGETGVAAGTAVAMAATTVVALVAFNRTWVAGDTPSQRGASAVRLPRPGNPPSPAIDGTAPARSPDRPPHTAPPPTDAAQPAGTLLNRFFPPQKGPVHNPPPDCQVCIPIDAPFGLASTGVYVNGIDTNPQDTVDEWEACAGDLTPNASNPGDFC